MLPPLKPSAPLLVPIPKPASSAPAPEPPKEDLMTSWKARMKRAAGK